MPDKKLHTRPEIFFHDRTNLAPEDDFFSDEDTEDEETEDLLSIPYSSNQFIQPSAEETIEEPTFELSESTWEMPESQRPDYGYMLNKKEEEGIMSNKLERLSKDLKQLGLAKEAFEMSKLAAPKDQEFVPGYSTRPDDDIYPHDFKDIKPGELEGPNVKEWHEDMNAFEPGIKYHRHGFSPSDSEWSGALFEEDELPGWQKEREEAGKHKDFYVQHHPTRRRQIMVEMHKFLANLGYAGKSRYDLSPLDVDYLSEEGLYTLSPEAYNALTGWLDDKEGHSKGEESGVPDLYEGDFSKEVPIGKGIEEVEESEETKLSYHVPNLIKMANHLDQKRQFELADQIDHIIEEALKE